MHLLAADRKYPECLLMELEIVPIEKQYQLYLKINFNYAWESLGEGRVKFGLKGGQLKLLWQDIEMPLIAREFGSNWLINTAGAERSQTWIFTPQPGETLLKNCGDRILLATFKVKDLQPRIEAVFTVSPPEISLTDTEGLWRHDINPNKYTVLERKLVYLLQANKLPNYLSLLQLGTEENPFKSNYYKPEAKEINLPPSQVTNLIDRVYTAATENFLELAEIVGLDPLSDFAGGNFLANNLNNVQLSGAKLYRSNFRGADLTDADLSEADLSYSKLSGADLSGAYLENTNLSKANLHRASLAVANLIGADLSYADLRDVNLTNTNLTGAKVNKALFSNNIGLSPEMQADLLSRGAIFDNA